MIREFDVLTTRMLGESITVEFALDAEAGACEVDPAQFGSAVLNLVVNARDAMPEGGRLTVKIKEIELNEVIEKVRRIIVDEERQYQLILALKKLEQDRIFNDALNPKKP